ncbi:tyrosine-type recombinase/integrase [Nocardia terpenica]|uniref:tyrosine-type recombinase/integrase n=1 Tax=Nocardia terpenica TaxID=455432 RepID=UPI001893A1F3|nr:tyrosine-type recombinase/integrase [Nocardia terpenica]MBF6062639.1 tyrosine-type recombinase/integrase [Nocardia terpenica]MBF6104727.1 tyrosine-type recombinase/integrase [Nocardia terpenica]MBF6123401.1 tyrosine-type recombinase/integrase [Nocardia terpenica]MBF6156942.1 tyrosine-type recombinase/integrase [Nocardia terpenica]
MLDTLQYQSIVEQMAPPWQVFTDFLAITGARLGEAAALAEGDLDPDRETCRIEQAWRPGPGGWILGPAPRPRTTGLRANLSAHLQISGSGQELFRIDGACGPRLIRRYLGRVWQPSVLAVTDTLLGGRRPAVAALRTTCALWLADAGMPWPMIATHLGYRDIRSVLVRHGHVPTAGDRA